MTTTDHVRSRVHARGVFQLMLAALRRRHLRRATTRALRDLDDHLLKDVGLIRRQLDPVSRHPGGW